MFRVSATALARIRQKEQGFPLNVALSRRRRNRTARFEGKALKGNCGIYFEFGEKGQSFGYRLTVV